MDTVAIVLNNEADRLRAIRLVQSASLGMFVSIMQKTRSNEQNAKLWAMLTDISKQVVWHGQKLTTKEWKDFFTATLKGFKFVPNMDATGFIAVGGSTSNMTKKLFSDLIEIIYMMGAKNGVQWSEPALTVYNEWLSMA